MKKHKLPIETYRGHVLQIRHDLDKGENPRITADYKLKFVSTMITLKTSDIESFEPTGNFYIDVFRYATNELERKNCYNDSYLDNAYDYVNNRLIIFPVSTALGNRRRLILDYPHAVSYTPPAKYANNEFFGALFMTIEEARSLYGNNKTINELYDSIKLEATQQIIEYSNWLSGFVNYITVTCEPKLYNELILMSDETAKIAHEWKHKAEQLTVRICNVVFMGCSNYETVKRSVDKLADWLISELHGVNLKIIRILS